MNLSSIELIPSGTHKQNFVIISAKLELYIDTLYVIPYSFVLLTHRTSFKYIFFDYIYITFYGLEGVSLLRAFFVVVISWGIDRYKSTLIDGVL